MKGFEISFYFKFKSQYILPNPNPRPRSWCHGRLGFDTTLPDVSVWSRFKYLKTKWPILLDVSVILNTYRPGPWTYRTKIHEFLTSDEITAPQRRLLQSFCRRFSFQLSKWLLMLNVLLHVVHMSDHVKK